MSAESTRKIPFSFQIQTAERQGSRMLLFHGQHLGRSFGQMHIHLYDFFYISSTMQ
jgi:hypothetical protein